MLSYSNALYINTAGSGGVRDCPYSRKETKSNRAEFYEITNEIGSLIESVVRHGREREATSERYKKACDDFLR